MKTLKIKAFHKTRKEIYHVSFINFDRNTITLICEYTANGEWYVLEPLKNVVIMMCTNLKDNEGTDIYEGDIVDYKDGEYSFTGVVTYSPFGWFVKTEDDNVSFEHFADESKGVANCTVVGSYVEEWKIGINMKKFLIEESGYYKISMTIEALNEEDSIDSIYGYLPRFIDVESEDREVTEVEEWW